MTTISKECNFPLQIKNKKARNKINLDNLINNTNTQDEENDFWNDCVEINKCESNKVNGTINQTMTTNESLYCFNDLATKHLNGLQNYDNFIKGKKDKDERSSNSIDIMNVKRKGKGKKGSEEDTKKHFISTRILNSSSVGFKENEKSQPKSRSALAVERSRNLYTKAINKIENRKKLVKEKEDFEKSRELENCTFQPQINKNSKLSQTRNKAGNLTTRSNLNEKNTIILDKPYSFRPKINTINLNKVFENKGKFDRNSQKYYQRVEKARNLENEKKQKLNPDYNSIYDKLYRHKNNPYRFNTITLTNEDDDYCTFNPNQTTIHYGSALKTLHDHLHSIDLDKDK